MEYVRTGATLRFERRFHGVLSTLAAIGVFGAYYMIAKNVPIAEMLKTDQANNLSAVLLSGSSIATLRYAAIVAAPVGVVLAIQHKIKWPVAIFDVGLLLLVGLLSSRLSIIMATTIFVFLYVQIHPLAKLRIVWLLWGSAAMFALLTILNYTRNANYYRMLGVNNPIAMNLYQIQSYVGAPSQVSVGVAHAMVHGSFVSTVSPAAALQAVVPTFAQSVKSSRSSALDPAIYGYQVDIAPNLNANSAFADTYAHFGWWGLVYSLIVLGLAAMLYGHLTRYDSLLRAGAAVIAYGLLEYWRSYLFNQGGLIFALISVVIAARVARGLRGSRTAKERPEQSTIGRTPPRGRYSWARSVQMEVSRTQKRG